MYSRNLQLKESNNGVIYVTTDFFSSDHISVGFSTRFGGVSPLPYHSLNLGYSVADDQENVRKNRYRFLKALGCDLEMAVLGNQVHSSNLVLVTEEHLSGREYLDNPQYGIPNTDGLLTNISGITLLGSFADCVPLYFYEPNLPMIGLSHAGWRGTYDQIAAKTISELLKHGGFLSDIKVIVGPSIGPCCYQVGEEIYRGWKENERREEVFYGSFNDLYLDLWKANYLQLIDIGVPSDNILLGNMCTSCNKDIFFSYRNGGTETGRMMGLISILP